MIACWLAIYLVVVRYVSWLMHCCFWRFWVFCLLPFMSHVSSTLSSVFYPFRNVICFTLTSYFNTFLPMTALVYSACWSFLLVYSRCIAFIGGCLLFQRLELHRLHNSKLSLCFVSFEILTLSITWSITVVNTGGLRLSSCLIIEEVRMMRLSVSLIVICVVLIVKSFIHFI